MFRNDDLIESAVTQEPHLTRVFLGAALLGLVLIGAWEWFASRALPPLLAVPLTLALVAGYAALLVTVAVIGVWRVGRTKDRLLSEARQEAESGKRLAIYDRTTGLFHRWYFELRVNEEAERCRRYGSSMAVLTVEVKPSGLVQDLREWREQIFSRSQLVARTVRSVDISASLGDLEYAICLPRCDRDGAATVAKRLLQTLDEDSATIGFGLYPEHGTDGEALLAHARERPHFQPAPLETQRRASA